MFILSIFFILTFSTIFTFGDIFLNLFSKYCNVKIGKYNIIDKVFLGMFVLVFITLVLNFFTAINIYIIIPIILIGIIYAFYSVIKRRIKLRAYKTEIYCGIFVLVLISFLGAIYHDSSDSQYYHMQYIEAIYKYPIIKGLANLEDRYGFNSSFFFLYPLFGLKFIMKLHLYDLNYFLFGCILLYLLVKIFRENSFIYSIYVLLLAFVYTSDFMGVSSSSNDTSVALMAFYITIRYLDDNVGIVLLYLFIPFLMLTTKLSSSFLIIFSFIGFFYLVKTKQYKTTISIAIICFIFISAWLTRNVILSGYLIYPIYSIDLFNVSWKVPRVVAMIEHQYIKDFAVYIFKYSYYRLTLSSLLNIQFVSQVILQVFSLTSVFLILYLFRKKRFQKGVLLLCLLASMIVVSSITPDFRFYCCYLYSIIVVVLYTTFFQTNYKSLKVRNILLTLSFVLTFYTFYENNYSNFNAISSSTRNTLRVFFRPIETASLVRFRVPSELETIQINNYQMVINKDPLGIYYNTYENFPSSSLTGYPLSNPSYGFKIQALETIEFYNSNNIKAGIKTRDEWKQRFEEQEEEIFDFYKKGAQIRLKVK